jgi:CRISPR-associated protein Csd2
MDPNLQTIATLVYSIATFQTASEIDLDLLWEALINLFEHDRSAARGLMTVCGLYVFQHESALGNAPAHELFDRIQIQKREGLDYTQMLSDYEILIDDSDLPAGVQLQKMVHRHHRK